MKRLVCNPCMYSHVKHSRQQPKTDLFCLNWFLNVCQSRKCVSIAKLCVVHVCILLSRQDIIYQCSTVVTCILPGFNSYKPHCWHSYTYTGHSCTAQCTHTLEYVVTRTPDTCLDTYFLSGSREGSESVAGVAGNSCCSGVDWSGQGWGTGQ